MQNRTISDLIEETVWATEYLITTTWHRADQTASEASIETTE